MDWAKKQKPAPKIYSAIKMLTLFSIPKPFAGRIATIQGNAIQSWTRLRPGCEVILFGDDAGVQEAAGQFHARHIPDVTRNEFGTPLLDSVFDRVEREASHPLLCYVNADIILRKDFLAAVQSIPFGKFLMVGRRWDIDLKEAIDFTDDGWDGPLEQLRTRQGTLHPSTGIDYFVFPRRLVGGLPPFAVGRPGWDNWFIYRARSLGIPVVDATRVTTVIHQNHDYTHVKEAIDNTAEGPEGERNRKLVGGWQNVFYIRDATHVLVPDRCRDRGSSARMRRNLWTLPVSALKPCKQLNYLFGAGIRFLKRRLRSAA